MNEDQSFTDQELIARARANDATAFETLFLRYRDTIMGMYLRRGNNANDASDLLQETFVKVYLNLHRYNPEYPFGQWVTVIARNTLIDHARRRKEHVVFLDQEQQGGGRINLPSTAPTPEEKLIEAQNIRQFNVLIGQLPKKYQRILELRYAQEYSYEEIAATLELPLGTVKTQIRRAKENFMKLVIQQDI